MKKGIFLIIYAALIGVKVFGMQDSTVNVKDFGAVGDGKHDDAEALTKAITFALQNNKTCYIPKSKKFYNLSNSIRIKLNANSKLSIQSNGALLKPTKLISSDNIWQFTAFRQHAILVIGPDKAGSDLSNAFNNNKGVSISISGLNFDGSYAREITSTAGYDADLAVGLQVSAENVFITNCNFNHFFGYGALIHGAKTVKISSTSFNDVGGRGNTYFSVKKDTDAFGDGLHISSLKPEGSVILKDCVFKGKKIANKRSRDAITFEYNFNPYTAEISNCNFSGFAKGIHTEEKGQSKKIINNCSFTDFNIGITNAINNGSNINITESEFSIGSNDGQDPGAANSFINYQTSAKTKVSNTTFNFVGTPHSYQTFVGIDSLSNCVINANNKNIFFADGNTVFYKCRFLNFGGDSYSFFSNNGTTVFTLRDCSFEGAKVFADKKSRLNIVNSNHKNGATFLLKN